MNRLAFFSATAAAIVLAAPAGAYTIVNAGANSTVQATAADLNASFFVFTAASTPNNAGSFAKLSFKLTAVTSNSFTFDYRFENQSVVPAATSRMGQVGFDITGTPGSGLTVADGMLDYFEIPGNNNGNFSGLGNRDICLQAGSNNNCNGGGNLGILSGLGNSKTGQLVFTYASNQPSITFGRFVTRWQAAQNGESTSGGSVNIVPEPATWAMMLGGFGLMGAAMRRRRRTAVTFA